MKIFDFSGFIEAGRREPEEMELKRKIAGMGLQPELEEQRRLLGND